MLQHVLQSAACVAVCVAECVAVCVAERDEVAEAEF